ncbi:winged helix-turn-helix domain-containing protein [Pseudoalteromonas sp. SMS1]|uniref:winged helix-turn-helix domain-containing protein n=1 Tax=Pseudoalteromonas sp. SMS1 TaxID=2908894 RepID=UPI001F264E8E|nr:winged helix-turn-helix domain-containing protein [Pseudoalteromonas sp. SMS1]MCF2860417.1 winged helix-turn-helix domain-containing protein [Pseudoalteromonas sp. SMS1]
MSPALPNSLNEATKAAPVRFGFLHWYFDSEKDELWNGETNSVSKLEPQVARLLTILLTQQGLVISRAALNEALWPNTIVEANSLYQLLTKLRKELKDNARSPIYIKTVPKKGYLFLPDIKIEPALKTYEAQAVETVDIITAPVSLLTTIKAKLLKHCWAFIFATCACFSAIAFFSSTPSEIQPPHYERHDITYDLGVEFNIAAHADRDLLAYVEKFNTLEITDKSGKKLFKQTFGTRVAHPTWHPTEEKLAFWQYLEDACILHISDGTASILHSSQPISCHLVTAPSWKSDKELVLTIKENQGNLAYLYRYEQNQLVQIPLPRKPDESYIGAVRAWAGQIYYLIVDTNYHTRLVSLDGKVHMLWDFPLWLFNFDPAQQSIISNDGSAHHNLIGKYRSGQTYPIFATTQGMFSSLSVDKIGNIYTAAESWQVNIRDEYNLPIFSSSSYDYLPVTNKLGETVFMSRRTGYCEIYLHTGNQVKQLSFHKGYEYVDFLAWDPKLSKILANRDRMLVLYDRNDVLTSFHSQHQKPLKQFGWHNNHTIWSSDGKHVHTFNLDGHLLSRTRFESEFITYHVEDSNWVVVKDGNLYRAASLINFNEQKQLLAELPSDALNAIRNPRLKNGQLYWQSSWSKTDLIWKASLTAPFQVTNIKKEPLIWHYDIAPDGALLVAKMESVESDIKLIKPRIQ